MVLKSIEGNEETTVQCDCQLYRKMDKDIIILEILSNMIEVMQKTMQTEQFLTFCKEYEKQIKGIKGWFKSKFNKIDIKETNRYDNYKIFVKLLDALSVKIEKTGKMPEEQIEKFAFHQATSQNQEQDKFFHIKKQIKLDSKNTIAMNYSKLCATIENSISVGVDYEGKYIEFTSESETTERTQQQEKVIKRIEEVNALKKIIIEILEGYKSESAKGIMVYLDDFYQIPKEEQPYIIQYFHDIYKATKSNVFCFKVVTLPSALKINHDNEVVFSIKDDFSSVYLDYDLSNLEKVQEHLLEILIALDHTIGLSIQDVKSLFTNDYTLKFLVIATGGIPRDFMTAFCEAVRISKRDAKERIGKDQIYEVIKNLKNDKDNNIEVDSELPTEKIEYAIESINAQIIRNMRTNVILYPIDKAEQHEKILRNLTNLRYLHLIKSKMTSEKTKQECRAYLIDMTFYACARIPSSFNFCEFWIMDDASRLNNLRRAPIWSFPEDDVKEILG